MIFQLVHHQPSQLSVFGFKLNERRVVGVDAGIDDLDLLALKLDGLPTVADLSDSIYVR